MVAADRLHCSTFCFHPRAFPLQQRELTLVAVVFSFTTRVEEKEVKSGGGYSVEIILNVLKRLIRKSNEMKSAKNHLMLT